MKYSENRVDELKIAYIGGGSRGWAWGLMSDLALADDISGDVYLYDIDYEAAKRNELIGNKYKDAEGSLTAWQYHAVATIGEALTGADFVFISILPGTFDEMESDVHTPEKYGIYQSVGDTVGPGGVVRSLRTIPMFEEIALAVKEYCPNAWVINYTNPMTVCTKTLYRTFPEIKAFGCCHEVFGTQKFLLHALESMKGLKNVKREDIKNNVIGVNHFTWLTDAHYQDVDVMQFFGEICEKYAESGYTAHTDNGWMNKYFGSAERVKMDLYKRYGLIAAAGDRHLAEFCEGSWYLENPEVVAEWKFGLTPVSWRKEDLQNRLDQSDELAKDGVIPTINATGEEGVLQMRALLGLCDLVTNVNIPNVGQIPNLPLGAVVETNAVFRRNELRPVMAGNVPDAIYPLISRIVGEQELIVEAGIRRDLNMAFRAFVNDPQVRLSVADAKKLFIEMVENTRKYLSMYPATDTLV